MRRPDSSDRHFAEFYDLYVDGFNQDLRVYLDLAAKYPGPVLELGCATGRVSTILAEHGYPVVGVETCREMLLLARRRCAAFPDLVRLQKHDLRRQPLPERFHVALVTLYSFNSLIDVEEQRLFLRHLRQSMRSPGLVALDLSCPLSLGCPERLGAWRVIERTVRGRRITVRDRREMLNPLLERRCQEYRIDSGPSREVVTHRRYIPPGHAIQLLEEAGFEEIRWVRDYDLSTSAPVSPEDRPTAPFLILADA